MTVQVTIELTDAEADAIRPWARTKENDVTSVMYRAIIRLAKALPEPVKPGDVVTVTYDRVGGDRYVDETVLYIDDEGVLTVDADGNRNWFEKSLFTVERQS